MLYFYIMAVILHYLLETLHHLIKTCILVSLYNLLKPLRTVEHKLFIIAQKITILKQIK